MNRDNDRNNGYQGNRVIVSQLVSLTIPLLSDVLLRPFSGQGVFRPNQLVIVSLFLYFYEYIQKVQKCLNKTMSLILKFGVSSVVRFLAVQLIFSLLLPIPYVVHILSSILSSRNTIGGLLVARLGRTTSVRSHSLTGL